MNMKQELPHWQWHGNVTLQVANAMAAKVKLLQRELKTVKADLAFSKERCAQLEEENRLLRDGNHDADADEDLVRARSRRAKWWR